MPEFRLAARPAIAEDQMHELAGQAGVTIALVTDYAIATVMARRKQAEELARRVHAAFGLELPFVPRRTVAGAMAFAWAGPDHWLAMTTQSEGAAFTAALRSLLEGVGSVSDQSDGRAVVRVGGQGARDALAKGVPIDLHPRAFAPGDCAATLVGHIAVHIWQVDAVPTYELAVPRSMAASFLDWLGSAATVT